MQRMMQAAVRAMVLYALAVHGQALSQAASQIVSQTDNAIAGHVMDGRSPVAGALVLAQQTGSAQQLLTRTDASGSFQIVHLLPGEYTVTITAAGHAPQTRSHILVSTSGIVQIDLAYAPPVPLSMEPAAGERISDTEAHALPVLDRRAEMLPAILSTSGTTSEAVETPTISYRSVPTAQNAALLDGAENTQALRGDAIASGRSASIAPREAVEEMTVYATSAPASIGRAAGGSVNVTTRRGTQQFHGAMFFLWRESALDAFDPTAIVTRYNNGLVSSSLVKPKDTRQQWGLRLGGPLWRGRLYGIWSSEWQRRSFPAVSTPADPNFFLLTSTQRALLQNRGVTNTRINSALRYLDSLMGELPRRADYWSQMPRLDFDLTARHRLMLSYNSVRWSSPAGSRTRPVVDRGLASIGDDNMHVDGGQVQWAARWGSRFTTDLRARMVHDYEFQLAPAPLPQEPATGPGGYAPQVNIASDFYFGKPATLNRRGFPDERRWQLAANFTWTHGHVTLLGGAETSRVQEVVDNLPNEGGSYLYSSGTTNGRAGGLVDWITDYTFDVNAYPTAACTNGQNATLHYFCFQSFSQSFGQQATRFTLGERAAWLGIRWRINGTLSVDASLRYDHLQLPAAQRPNASLDAAFSDVGSTSTLPSPQNNLGPRVGFAWSPFGERQGVVRGGYGIVYGRLPGATLRTALADTGLPSSVVSVRVTSRTQVDPQCSSAGTSFGYPATYRCIPAGVPARTTAAMLFANDFHLPMVQQAHLSLERQLGWGMLLRISGVTALSQYLPNSVDINIAPANTRGTFQLKGGTGAVGVRHGDTFVVPLYTARRNASFGTVTAIRSNVTGTYNALLVEARRRMSQGLDLRITGAWQKSLDFGQSASAIPDRNGQFDPYEVGYDRGVSSLERRWRIVASGLWQPQWTLHEHLLQLAANGWSIAPILTASAGRPYSLMISGGDALSGGRESINGAGGLRYLPTVGPNTLRLPFALNLNLRLSKALPLHGPARLLLLGEAYNATNHVNVINVTQRAYLVGATSNGVTQLVFQDAATLLSEGLNQRPFGTLTQAGNDYTRQRQLQFGLRVEW
ncbi:TonB-dependent receptor [Terriglobus tenax]|uniref:TonB-dependent receptor n=1 Tax=Terriglobus tenax TaxID=1111115 RepID=UPI0021E03021|nr:carboxypeptidase-like regulatory domain-containing protein [Terriglobus tenax]